MLFIGMRKAHLNSSVKEGVSIELPDEVAAPQDKVGTLRC